MVIIQILSLKITFCGLKYKAAIIKLPALRALYKSYLTEKVTRSSIRKLTVYALTVLLITNEKKN